MDVSDSGDHLIKYLSRHFAALCVSYRLEGGQPGAPAHFFAASATLLCLRGMHFVLTAGHIVERLEELLADERVTELSASVADTFGLGTLSSHPVPIDLRTALRFAIDEDGLDFGVIQLHSHQADLMRRHSMVPIVEGSWNGSDDPSMDAYHMLGLPTELMEERVHPGGDMRMTQYLIRVERLEEPPPSYQKKGHPQFVGRIADDIPLRTIDGMSGGPIFGWKAEPRLKYWIVALQSAWLPQSKTIIATPISIVCEMLGASLDEAFEQLQLPDASAEPNRN